MATSSPTKATFLCRLCAADTLRLYYTQGNDGRFRYYRCDRCGLVNLDLAHGTDQTQYTDEWIDPTDDSSPENQRAEASLEFIGRYVKTPGALLDIGCGNGRLLYRAAQAGWRVKGIELSAEMAAAVQAALGITVVGADFLQMELAEEDLGRYDLICLRHVLEHLPDSRRALSAIRAMLRPAGLAYFEIPNIEGWDKRLKRWIVNRGLRERRYSADFVAGHCNEFCRSSFEYLLRETGFKLVRWETYSNKPLGNLVYNHVHIGNKARALVQRVSVS